MDEFPGLPQDLGIDDEEKMRILNLHFDSVVREHDFNRMSIRFARVENGKIARSGANEKGIPSLSFGSVAGLVD
ncbi:MAG TPA: hypothetical protein VJS30_07345 [Paraburkholderia sp.]|nr:hypothetical protein [Paraburkholderia sp.]